MDRRRSSSVSDKHVACADDLTGAVAQLCQALGTDDSVAEAWTRMAEAHRRVGDMPNEERALQHALSADRRHLPARAAMARLMERAGRPETAFDHWLRVVSVGQAQPGGCDDDVDSLRQARAFVRAHRRNLAARVDLGLQDVRRRYSDLQRHRFEQSLNRMLGRSRIAKHGIQLAGMTQESFFDNRLFGWFGELRDATSAIRKELSALLADPRSPFEPYVAMPEGTSENIWSPLDRQPAWNALHLWRHGQRIEAACARCPVTAAAVSALPLIHLAGRTPNVLFSILQPGTRLPPHAGVSNVRTIVHLPLVVPDRAGLRVGSEIRTWREGHPLAFDDTVDHEAWNLSDRYRAVLILDVWNPHVTAVERDLITAFAAIAPALEDAFMDD